MRVTTSTVVERDTITTPSGALFATVVTTEYPKNPKVQRFVTVSTFTDPRRGPTREWSQSRKQALATHAGIVSGWQMTAQLS